MNAGWGFPGAAKKAHYFATDDVTSLCRKWMFSGERFDTMHDHRDNCVVCKRLLKAVYNIPADVVSP